ncbi:hypothetical protein MES5069_220185 [Mesorhizobium escarrei]|uniref:Uncharacterized protein n=1 Tax=Mesorhizobium escarrei TaxID=666018 RepID=A0ABN8JN05_9HYPH|nr:hypothetical protein MES5069_220185 [Mesorhizobium escarrei]
MILPLHGRPALLAGGQLPQLAATSNSAGNHLRAYMLDRPSIHLCPYPRETRITSKRPLVRGY